MVKDLFLTSKAPFKVIKGGGVIFKKGSIQGVLKWGLQIGVLLQQKLNMVQNICWKISCYEKLPDDFKNIQRHKLRHFVNTANKFIAKPDNF